MCYNLGADYTLDPLTPSKGLLGNHYLWNNKTPIGTADVVFPSWDASYTTSATAWQAANDPCPSGFTVPSVDEWQGIIDYYGAPTTSASSTWLDLGTVYTLGWKVGDYLFIPAAGSGSATDGSMANRSAGRYWSSTLASNSGALLAFTSGTSNMSGVGTFMYGGSVRCIQIPVAVTPKTTLTCGAYTIPANSPAGTVLNPTKSNAVWREFMCHNLGADATLDPLTPSKGLLGNYYQWNKKTPIGTADILLPSYDLSYTTSASTWESANNPCPSGFTVPSVDEWQGMVDYYGQPSSSTWLDFGTVYTRGWKVGNYLFFPADGVRYTGFAGAVVDPGFGVYYWSRVESSSGSARYLNVSINGAGATNTSNNKAYGMPVRCISE
jgi:uncharacterized protein (TIGR02145 family)